MRYVDQSSSPRAARRDRGGRGRCTPRVAALDVGRRPRWLWILALGGALLAAMLLAPGLARAQDAGGEGGVPEAFARRQAAGVGLFLGRAQLGADRRTLGDVLRRIPGLGMPTRGTEAAGGERSTSRGVAAAGVADGYGGGHGGFGAEFSNLDRCPVVFYLNGSRLNRGTEARAQDIADLYGLPTSMLMAVEVYRGAAEIPLELSGGDGRCAVVGLWTS